MPLAQILLPLLALEAGAPDLFGFQLLPALLFLVLSRLRREGIGRLFFGLFCFDRCRLERGLLLRLADNAVRHTALDLVGEG